MIAGMFPLIHLGRFWVFYFIIPYPSQRQIWPNFISPLVWDVLAISTYFIVSTIFFFVGLIPDLAAFRDTCERTLGPKHWKTRLYRTLSLDWSGAGSQWRHYRRSYLYFAALVTPLVISVHSIVSWDFAMSNLSGWHSTLFAPYFVAGAIHSGLAMAFILLIPIRRWLNLKHLIRIHHLEMIAKTLLVTTCIMAYSYAVEYLLTLYGGDKFDVQYANWRATGGIAPIYWSLFFFNVLAPLSLVFQKNRQNTTILFAVGILVNIGMWLERAMIVTGSLAHDFMPHNWSAYLPNDLTEIGITIGSFCFLFFFYSIFAKTLPVIATADVKSLLAEEQTKGITAQPPTQQDIRGRITQNLPPGYGMVRGIYNNAGMLLESVKKLRTAGFRQIEYFSPVKLEKVADFLGHHKSPVRFWTLAGALTGLIGGFSLAIGSAGINGLIVGGKHPVSLIPYCIPGFEGLILLGALANLTGFIVHTWSYGRKYVPYDPRFSRDGFAVVALCRKDELSSLKAVMAETHPEETHVAERRT
jgi:molybdopterin-containing oxidoreductase family membrane subunit